MRTKAFPDLTVYWAGDVLSGPLEPTACWRHQGSPRAAKPSVEPYHSLQPRAKVALPCPTGDVPCFPSFHGDVSFPCQLSLGGL